MKLYTMTFKIYCSWRNVCNMTCVASSPPPPKCMAWLPPPCEKPWEEEREKEPPAANMGVIGIEHLPTPLSFTKCFSSSLAKVDSHTNRQLIRDLDNYKGYIDEDVKRLTFAKKK